MGKDFLITEAVSRGTFQICEFLPLLATGLLETLDLLERFDRIWAGHIDGIEADPAACARRVDSSPILFTALLPRLGYTAAERLGRDYEASGGTDVRAFLVGKLGAEKAGDLLAPDRLLALGGPDEPNA
jgi:aspartate ammonia-lyase